MPLPKRKKILAVASGGGHWHQLQILKTAFEDHDVNYVTTLEGLTEQSGVKNTSVVPDCNANEIFKALTCAVVMFRLMISVRPDVVISTGALPGFLALAIGKLMGKRTLWIDSLANAEEYSKAGRYARYVADLRFTQWRTVAENEGGEFAGNLL